MNSNRTCTVEGCSRALYAKGLCAAHYTQQIRAKPDRPRCSIDGCEKTAVTRGWCADHYQRWRSHGDPLSGRIPRNAARNFLLHVACQHSSDDCLEWPYMVDKKSGYAQVQWNGEKRPANRVVCIVHHGNPPTPSHEAAHSCGNRKCVNPTHIRWATPKQNAEDKVAHGTALFGYRHPNTKISPDDVAKMRELQGQMPQTKIAEIFGLRASSVNRILSGKSRARG